MSQHARHHIEWEKIREARRMQNEPDDCHTCLHPFRAHDNELGRCNHTSVQYNPYEKANVNVVCICSQYRGD